MPTLSFTTHTRAARRTSCFSPSELMVNLYVKFILMYAVMGLILRVVLLFHPLTSLAGLSVWQYMGIFGLGLVNDLCAASLLFVPLWALCLSAGRWKFGRPQCYLFLTALVAGWLFVRYGTPRLEEFNRGLHRILGYVMLYWIVAFAVRLWCPRIRTAWLRVWFTVVLALLIGAMVFNVIAEWFFWNEFGVRYNFIAVDYLVYTHEVIGNIRESYPMGLITTAIALVTLLLVWIFFRHDIRSCTILQDKGWRMGISALYAPLALLAVPVLWLASMAQHSPNVYYNELQASGPYSFCTAFLKNSLEYDRFYTTLPEAEVAPEVLSPAVAAADTLDTPHIVLITIESMSADFMERFGNDRHLTPTLDSLYSRSLAFDRLFAAGNRTVRGLEALTLSRPPAPGESIIKRKDNTGYPSTADMLDRQGYNKVFFYGGDAYFDNMLSFFTGMGYDIVDSHAFDDADVHFRTIWGICDEDVYAKVVDEIDRRDGAGQKVFAHIMTTSNHRPYTYPEGRISIPPTAKSRDGGVMYSDYALGRFLQQAASKPWFDNTVFVVVADHCASSAGSIEIPLENYHIPALIYSPGRVEPRIVDTYASQIDLVPTLFAMLGWGTDPHLYGRDIQADDYAGRAFMATYQDLGLFEADTLTVLSPVRRIRQYVLAPTESNPLALRPLGEHGEGAPLNNAARRAISYYQSSSR